MKKTKLLGMRKSMILLCIYLLMLPVDAALGDIIGSISLANYVIALYIGFRLTEILRGRRLYNMKHVLFYGCYCIYYISSIVWASKSLNTWYLGSLMISFFMFFFSSIDKYSAAEYEMIENSLVYSGVITILIVALNYDYSYDGRFILNFSRYMDPNFFGIGFVVIIGKCMDNIWKKKKRVFNGFVVIGLMIVIFLTGSRGALLANGLVIMSSIFVNRDSNVKKIIYTLVLSITAVFLFEVILQVMPESVAERYNVDDVVSNGGSGRGTIWKEDFEYFKESNTFEKIMGNGFTTHVAINRYMGGPGKVAHNILMQSLMEGGITGVMVTISLFLKGSIVAWKKERYYIIWALMGMFIGGLTIDLHVVRFTWNAFFLAIIDRKVITTKTT